MALSPCLISDDGKLTICRPNAAQPLTRFVDTVDLGQYRVLDDLAVRVYVGDVRRQHVRYSPRRQFRCSRCGARRWAKNLKIITGGGWYDPMVLCADRHRWRR